MSIRFTFFRKEKMASDWANRIQLIRTIERVAAEKLGEAQASRFFLDLASGTVSENPDNCQVWHANQFWDEIVILSRGVVGVSELGGFVKEMVLGRFENIPHLQ
jgi:hypothetical protein